MRAFVLPSIESARFKADYSTITVPERAGLWRKSYALDSRHVYEKASPYGRRRKHRDKINLVTSHGNAEIFVGGLWAVHPGITAIRGGRRERCGICEICKTRIWRGFPLCG